MAFRGCWRGGYGGGSSYAKQEPFVLFPEDVTLPDVNAVTHEKTFVQWNLKLQNYWKASPYFLEEAAPKRQKTEVERFSDRQNKTFERSSLSQVLVLNKFPQELVRGKRKAREKKFQWNPESELKKLDIFEKLEMRDQGREEKGDKEKDEDEDEDEENEEAEEDMSEDDYYKNEDFDDDEDDYNLQDDGDGNY